MAWLVQFHEEFVPEFAVSTLCKRNCLPMPNYASAHHSVGRGSIR